ncbi:MAG: glycosyltransferase, partial [Pseudomonadota bacterium]|nr:glycosyltransferase [Pseudomonadota bacterium]
MNVLLMSRYGRLGASSRMRSLQYVPYLEANDVYVDWRPLLDDDYVRDLYAGRPTNWRRVAKAYVTRAFQLLFSRRYDVIWIEKELFPMLPATFERYLGQFGTPYVVDYDDAIFHNYDRHRRPWVRRVLGHKIDQVMARAACVLAGNQYLADRAVAAGADRVEILPTVIDLERYTVVPPDSPGFTIGWIGSPGTAPYLSLVADALRPICELPDTRLLLVGAGEAGPDLPAERRPWSEEREAADISEFDVGIMPLPDEPFERGKCGYKLIQYMASGKPVIASPVGVNREIVSDGVDGYLAV